MDWMGFLCMRKIQECPLSIWAKMHLGRVSEGWSSANQTFQGCQTECLDMKSFPKEVEGWNQGVKKASMCPDEAADLYSSDP